MGVESEYVGNHIDAFKGIKKILCASERGERINWP